MIDPEGLDIEAVIYAIVGVVVGVLLAGVLIGIVVRRVDGRRLPVALCFGIVAATALVVDAVVLSRTLSGDVTIWDVCWAVGLTTAAGWSWRLATPGGRTTS